MPSLPGITHPLLPLLVLHQFLNGGIVQIPFSPGEKIGHLLFVSQPGHVLHHLGVRPALPLRPPGKAGALLHCDDAAVILSTLLLSGAFPNIPQPARGFWIL